MIVVHTFTTKIKNVSGEDKSFFSVQGLEAIFHVSTHDFKEGDTVKFTIEKIEKSGPEKQDGSTPVIDPAHKTHPEEETKGGDLSSS